MFSFPTSIFHIPTLISVVVMFNPCWTIAQVRPTSPCHYGVVRSLIHDEKSNLFLFILILCLHLYFIIINFLIKLLFKFNYVNLRYDRQNRIQNHQKTTIFSFEKLDANKKVRKQKMFFFVLHWMTIFTMKTIPLNFFCDLKIIFSKNWIHQN